MEFHIHQTELFPSPNSIYVKFHIRHSLKNLWNLRENSIYIKLLEFFGRLRRLCKGSTLRLFLFLENSIYVCRRPWGPLIKYDCQFRFDFGLIQWLTLFGYLTLLEFGGRVGGCCGVLAPYQLTAGGKQYGPPRGPPRARDTNRDPRSEYRNHGSWWVENSRWWMGSRIQKSL